MVQSACHFSQRGAFGAVATVGTALLWFLWYFYAPVHQRPTFKITHQVPEIAVPPDPHWVHEITKFSCAKLFAGDRAELMAVRKYLTSTNRSEPCYRDRYLGFASCPDLRAAFRRPFNFTDDEIDFPIAYGLRVHTCATQVELLLRSIYASHNIYCLHVDGRSPHHFVSAMLRLAECLPNVVLAPIDYDFVYASASQMQADIECMRAVSQSPVRWRYFINLAGQELPLKTNYELVRMLRSFNGSSNVNIVPPSFASRQKYSLWCKDPKSQRTVHCPEPRRRKTLPPNNVTIYKSIANAAFSRAFVDYVLDPGSFAKPLYDWLSDTKAPEEHFYATLLTLPDTPGGVWTATETRAILWVFHGKRKCAWKIVRYVCILTSGNLPWLVGRPEPFANKFYYEDDPVAVRCLLESLSERESKQWALSAAQNAKDVPFV